MNLKDWQEDWGKRRDALAKLDKSVLVLLAVDWAYSVLPIFEGQFPKDKRPRLAIEVAEKYISSAAVDAVNADYWALRCAAVDASAAYAAHASASAAADTANAAYNAVAADYWVAASAAAAAADVIYWVACAEHGNWQFTYKTYLHALGPTNKAFDKQWLTPTVQSLVQAEHPELPIIADALEDAGCDNNDILLHLRSNPSFTRADWVWQRLKGKP